MGTPSRVRCENDRNRCKLRILLHFAHERNAIHHRHCAIRHHDVRATSQCESQCVTTIRRGANEVPFRCYKQAECTKQSDVVMHELYGSHLATLDVQPDNGTATGSARLCRVAI